MAVDQTMIHSECEMSKRDRGEPEQRKITKGPELGDGVEGEMRSAALASGELDHNGPIRASGNEDAAGATASGKAPAGRSRHEVKRCKTSAQGGWRREGVGRLWRHGLGIRASGLGVGPPHRVARHMGQGGESAVIQTRSIAAYELSLDVRSCSQSAGRSRPGSAGHFASPSRGSSASGPLRT